ncbi:MAG: sterol desaturase family protein [Proteobacteria bacterium]|nr:sterol desaturase family protein [Pseudomonadota bacterium]
MKRLVFRLLQPATVVLTVLAWAAMPATWLDHPWVPTATSILTLLYVQALEFANERHAAWRLDGREFLTDLFYLVLFYTVILAVETKLVEEPLGSAKSALGITTAWVLELPFIAQVALVLLLFELGQYWLHRLMHNSFLWWTHAPHHHITQLNALKGLVGNPLELFLISIGVTALLDVPPKATFCAFNILVAVSSFAHANVRFDPPRWYAFVFTTVETHSLHHQVGFKETRCNYANVLILLDHVFGTFRPGEAQVVGQDDRRRLGIREQFLFPLRPLLARARQRSASAGG